MADNKNYRPKSIAYAPSTSGKAFMVNLSVTTWGLVLVQGLAVHGGTIMPSGTVDIWETSTPGASQAPDHTTFSDSAGKYGVTCKAGKSLSIKYFTR